MSWIDLGLYAVVVLAAVGVGFILLATVGLLRMPDLYMRMQTASKASTLGAACVILATAVYFEIRPTPPTDAAGKPVAVAVEADAVEPPPAQGGIAGEIGISIRAMIIIIFLFLTAPVAAHMIGRAAYMGGVPLHPEHKFDDLAGQYDVDKQTLASFAAKVKDPPPESADNAPPDASNSDDAKA